jgi:tetratricopeptide (TPR) repeat protein
MLFEQGIQAQKSGKLAEAEAIYRQILETDPHNFDALHMLGIVCSERGQTHEAEHAFSAAAVLDPAFPPLFHNFGLHYVRQKQHENAIAQFDKAIALHPNYPPVLSDRGNALAQVGRLAESLDSHNKAVALAPNMPQVFANRALTHLLMKDHAAALRDYDEALKRAANFAAAWLGRGNVLHEMKRYEEAITAYDSAISLSPNAPEAWYGRGSACAALNRNGDALAAYDRVIALKPDAAEAWNGRGNALYDLNRNDEALRAFDRALALNPALAEAHTGRGVALVKSKRYDDAFSDFDQALTLNPDLAGAWGARGDALFELRRYDEALAAYAKATALREDFAEPRFSEGFIRLLLGDTDRGWQGYEARWKTRQYAGARRNFNQPFWNGGGDVRGKTILVHAEQGLGDTLMMCRYVPLVVARGARVILEVQPALVPLMQNLPGGAQVVARGSVLPSFDLHCPIMSLPLAFGTRMDNVPATIPYLKAPEDAVAHWRAKLPAAGLRVGIAWAGNPTYGKDSDRSILLKNILPASSVDGATFFGLQKDLREGDRQLMKTNPQIISLEGSITDFRDTAAVITCLDLVVSSDTSIVHLAGALGKSVWILLPANPDWRWLLERSDSPWYPTARLFRQKTDGDWSSVIDEVCAELLTMVTGGSRH